MVGALNDGEEALNHKDGNLFKSETSQIDPNAANNQAMKQWNQPPVIIFDACKNEVFTPKRGLNQLFKRLKSEYKVEINQEELTFEKLMKGRLVIFTGPREKFTAEEFEAMQRYVNIGGSLMFLLGEGGEQRFMTNLNYMLEQYGININNDSVIRTKFYKYFHPKEVCIEKGILNRGFNDSVTKLNNNTSSITETNLSFVYPYGATLTVEKPAIPLLSSGYISYPVNRPVAALYKSKTDLGRVSVIGSVHMFEDKWIDKEDNAKILDGVVQWLLHSNSIILNEIDAKEAEINDHHFLPDTKSLADRYKPCLQEGEELPKDFNMLFVHDIFKFDTSLVPEVIKLYEKLGVKHIPLSLIPPCFETPLPPLTPAVYPTSLTDCPPPALELFDLDEQFASEEVRLAHLTNRSEPTDIESYIKRAADIMGITARMKEEYRTSAAHILEFVFRQLVHFKKSSNDQISIPVDKGTFALNFQHRLEKMNSQPKELLSKPGTPAQSPDSFI
jgi:intraflagellar transport protein 52